MDDRRGIDFAPGASLFSTNPCLSHELAAPLKEEKWFLEIVLLLQRWL